MKNLMKIGFVIILLLLLVLAALYITKVQTALSTEKVKHKTESGLLTTIIKNNEKEKEVLLRNIDSIELEYSRVYASHLVLKKEYAKLKKASNEKKKDYFEKKPDERATDFLSITQTTNPDIPVFVNDSFLVPMDNVDTAMSFIYDEIFCDSVVIIKDQEIELLTEQISRLDQIIDLEREKGANSENLIELITIKLDDFAKENEQLEKKNKRQKFVSTAKTVLIGASLIYIIFK